MIEEIVKTYKTFSDSWIEELDFSKNSVSLIIVCANTTKNFNYEKVLLKFIEIERIIFNKEYYQDKIIGIKDLLLELKNNRIIFDADPIDHFDFLEENSASNFKIICNSVEYKYIENYVSPSSR